MDCAVLEDGKRVISERAMLRALGRASAGGQTYQRRRLGPADQLPIYLAPINLRPFVSEELLAPTSKPVAYLHPGTDGRRLVGHGLDATLIPTICEVWLQARAAGALKAQQLPTAAKAELLVRGLARVGIVALVDEATGYQEVRDRGALQAILEKYLRHELAAWAKRFPDEFYKGIFKLRGWEWKGMKLNRPQCVAAYTKDLVYARLAPGVLTELQQRTPKNESGRRVAAFHQWLTDDVGHPALAQHLHAIVTLMRVSSTWDQFKRMVDVAHPRRGDTLSMAFLADG